MLKLRNQELIILFVTIGIFLSFSLFLNNFFTTGNLLTLMRSVSILGILSVGMAVVVISKGIDLSLIATLAVGTAAASVLSWPPPRQTVDSSNNITETVPSLSARCLGLTALSPA